jgi:hypothetical protein
MRAKDTEPRTVVSGLRRQPGANAIQLMGTRTIVTLNLYYARYRSRFCTSAVRFADSW